MAKVRKLSLAGSARFAREARIATVAHLRDAEIARQWHMSKLLRAHQVHTANLGSPAAAQVMLYSGLGYRPPYPQILAEGADLVLRDEARYLAEADLVRAHAADV